MNIVVECFVIEINIGKKKKKKLVKPIVSFIGYYILDSYPSNIEKFLEKLVLHSCFAACGTDK